MTALQVFTAPPTYYGDKAGMKGDKVARFHAALAEGGIEPGNVLVHAAYVLNTASPEEEKATRARAGLARELERTQAIGALGAASTPVRRGRATPSKPPSGWARRSVMPCRRWKARRGCSWRTPPERGKTMGRTPEEIALMLSQVPSDLRHRTGYGLDTCHLFAAGHDIKSSPESLRAVLDRFEQVIGEAPAFFHLNDSQHPSARTRTATPCWERGKSGRSPFAGCSPTRVRRRCRACSRRRTTATTRRKTTRRPIRPTCA